MNEIKRLKLNLQHFAEDDSNNNQETEETKENSQNSDDKKVFELTQSELDSQNIKL